MSGPKRMQPESAEPDPEIVAVSHEVETGTAHV